MTQIAALLIVVLGLAHSILGERYILVRLFRREDLPKLFGSSSFTTRTLRFAWHITTVAWFGFATLLVQIGNGQLTSSSAAQIIGLTSIASGFLPLIITRGKHLSWLVLFIIGGALGLAVAASGVAALASELPATLPRAVEIAVDWRFVAFGAALTFISGLLFSVLPALSIARRGAASGPGRSRTRRRGAHPDDGQGFDQG